MPKILPYSTFGVKNISTLFASSRGGLADFAHVQIFVLDFLPVLKGGDSLNHAVSWFKGGSH